MHPHIAGFTPIKPRVRDHYLRAGDEQGKERDGRDPVGYADDRCMTGTLRIRQWTGGWHRRSITQGFMSTRYLNESAEVSGRGYLPCIAVSTSSGVCASFSAKSISLP